MRIFNGSYRGIECEFGIVDHTSGQMYCTLNPRSDMAKKLVEGIAEDTIREIFEFPPKQEFEREFTFAKVDDSQIQWTFMFDRQNSYSQMEYICHLGQKVEDLYQYGFKHGIIDPQS